MPSQTRADQFSDFEDAPPLDFDPEDDRAEFSDIDGSGQEGEAVTGANGRGHYAPVEKSTLRRREIALGPQYAGSRVTRKIAVIDEEEHDPFAGHDSDEGSDSEGPGSAGIENGTSASGSDALEELSDADGLDSADDFSTDGTSFTDEEENEDEILSRGARENADREQLRRIMNEAQTNVAAAIAQANKSDAEKGRAVKHQRQTFDTFLNSRIRLQQSLVAINSMQVSATSENTRSDVPDAIRSAERAAINLWNTLEGLRQNIQAARTGTKRKHFDATLEDPSSKIQEYMQVSELESMSYRRNVLQKWSAKTQGATAQPASRKLIGAPRQSTIVDMLNEQLSNTERLIKRTRLPRSCAPVQASAGMGESADIFDDADFYGVMLKELLEQRSIDSVANVQVDVVAQQFQAAREAKTKKSVDTKASKGRKIRYTVHEKLQNFMAPEDRGSWTERQVDELFGSLLGKRLALGEEEIEGRENEGDLAQEEALMLFRN